MFLTTRSAAIGAFAVLTGIVSPCNAQQTVDRFVGHWLGTLVGPAGRLRLGLTVTKDSTGKLAGEMVSLDQGNTKMPSTLAVRGDTLIVTIALANATYTAVPIARGDSLQGTFVQGIPLPLMLGRVASLPAARRPQEPKPPFPYDVTEVAFESIPGVQLSGTLTIPHGPGPFPAVALVTGSGAQNRDEELMGHRPFLVLADYLARHGIAALRYDDRGVGKSTGSFATATSADFAYDAEAAVKFLRATPRIAANRVGIVGHSEGGLVAPIVAAQTTDVAFIVLLAGTGIRGDSILLLQQSLIGKANGVPQASLDQAAAANRRLYAAVTSSTDSADAAKRIDDASKTILEQVPADQHTTVEAQLRAARGQLLAPWMRYFLTYDPRPTLQKVRVPVLALNGTLDLQVPYRENLSAIKAALEAGGNRDVRIVELPGLNHLFQSAKTGSPNEYQTIEETFSPEALKAISDWIVGLKPLL